MLIHPQIRPAKPEDVPDIYAMVRELAEFEKLADKVDSTEEKDDESKEESTTIQLKKWGLIDLCLGSSRGHIMPYI